MVIKVIIEKSVGNFYGTGIDIWAGFGPVGITEKKIWAYYEQLLRPVFSCCHGQNEKKRENDLKTCINEV